MEYNKDYSNKSFYLSNINTTSLDFDQFNEVATEHLRQFIRERIEGMKKNIKSTNFKEF